MGIVYRIGAAGESVDCGGNWYAEVGDTELEVTTDFVLAKEVFFVVMDSQY